MADRTKKEAEKEASALLKRMRGKGWKKRVWENMGWHYDVRNGNLTISPSCGAYFGLLSDNSQGCGNYCWTCHDASEHRKDPNKAAEIVVKNARKKMSQCLKTIEAAEKVLGIEPKK